MRDLLDLICESSIKQQCETSQLQDIALLGGMIYIFCTQIHALWNITFSFYYSSNVVRIRSLDTNKMLSCLLQDMTDEREVYKIFCLTTFIITQKESIAAFSFL